MDSVREIFYPQARKTVPHQSTVRTKAVWLPLVAPQSRSAVRRQAPTVWLLRRRRQRTRSGAVVGKKHPAPKNLRSKDAGIVCGPAVNGELSAPAGTQARAARRRGPT